MGDQSFKDFFANKRVAISGAAGTVGCELVDQLLSRTGSTVLALDCNESAIYFMHDKYREDNRFEAYLCDVRDYNKLIRVLDGVDFFFHTAALKQLPICEVNPFEAVQTNIIGAQNIIRASEACLVKRVIITSSDKAVNPSNVMGASKLMAEKLFTASNVRRGTSKRPIFASTRFGNVAGSRGSVIPLFCQQIAAGGPLTITDANMTRFVMTLTDAVSLTMKSMILAKGGEVFVTKMKVLNILDLSEVMSELLAPLFGHRAEGIERLIIGPRPGEKIHEELLNGEETRRAIEREDMFVVLPALRNLYEGLESDYGQGTFQPVTHVYTSDLYPAMSKQEINDFLLEPGVLPNELRSQLGRCKGAVS